MKRDKNSESEEPANNDVLALIEELTNTGLPSSEAYLYLGDVDNEDGWKSMNELVSNLTNDDWRLRRDSIIGLGMLGFCEAELDVIDMLQDEWDEVRYAAIWALGNIQGDLAVSPLMNLLESSDDLDRTCAAQALGNICDPRSVEALVDPLYSNISSIRIESALALGKIGDIVVSGQLNEIMTFDDDYQVRTACAVALGWFGDSKAVIPLVEGISAFHHSPFTAQLWEPYGDRLQQFQTIVIMSLRRLVHRMQIYIPPPLPEPIPDINEVKMTHELKGLIG